jgi:hypothetical protein
MTDDAAAGDYRPAAAAAPNPRFLMAVACEGTDRADVFLRSTPHGM